MLERGREREKGIHITCIHNEHIYKSYGFPGGLSTLLATSELMCPGGATGGRPLGIAPAGNQK